jgi:ABC-type transport system substrate-binding protein
LACVVALFSGCTPNNPYRGEEKEANVFYTSFSEPPKHLDPARSYSSNEYELIAQIYEPPLQYHYLRRPYELAPLLAERVPIPEYYDRNMRRLPSDAEPSKVYRSVYEIRIRKGVMYQPHPAFAMDRAGKPVYRHIAESSLGDIDEIRDFKELATRELKADDFIFQIKRLADPSLHSPILPIIAKYINGLDEFAEGLKKDLAEIRKERKASQGASYNQELDERRNPVLLDYSKRALPGVVKVDDHAYRIILKGKYPQFVYWLAMPFFAPVPEEAVRFYREPALADRNITIDRFPIGTGPFMFDAFNPNLEITLVKNTNFRGEAYPSEGEQADALAGLLKDAGKTMPFIDRVVYKLEKEAIPRWNKFLQGYYDASGIGSDSFDQAVVVSAGGGAELTDMMKEKGIELITAVMPTSHYMGFNMLDDVVGGYSERARKLRLAISIALDYEEYIEIFNNGRGVPAMGPLPPGIFGRLDGEHGINPYVYRWDAGKQKPVRRTIDEARALMREAGYPDGRDEKGRPLVISFDNAWTGVDAQAMLGWYAKKLKFLGIQLENRTTDYNRFQEKMQKGNFQFFGWGWNADYPDPENFFFLLAGANSKVARQGENAANYASPAFDALFSRMENMESGPARLAIIKEMTAIARADAPWVWGFHPVAFELKHGWVNNIKPNTMANNTMKYVRVDPVMRAELRKEWNRPKFWPIAAGFILVALAAVPAIRAVMKKLGYLG